MSGQDPFLSPWWSPARHADRRPLLLLRNRIKAQIRTYFETQGFTEVETACLQVSPGNETHLEAFETRLIGPDLASAPRYLHTSPEFAMKKLLAAGEERIFTFAPVFRNRESGALHAPEFTMLEWYRANEPYETVMADAAEILRLAAGVAGARLLSWRGATCLAAAEPQRVTVAEAFSRHAGIDLLATIAGPAGQPDREALGRALAAAGLTARDSDTWADLFSRALAAFVEPKLGLGRPELLCEYPASESALARPVAGDPRVAERFELYVAGVELANGFGELVDPHALRANLVAQMDERERRHGSRYPIDDDFIAAVAAMPPASGCALGFDRLVMLAAGATHIDQVLWTPPVR